jgi:hypothetical protein
MLNALLCDISARVTVRWSPAIESEAYFPLAVVSVFPFNVHSENRSRKLPRFSKEDGVVRGVSQDRVRCFGQCQDAGRVLEAAGSTVDLKGQRTMTHHLHEIYAITALRQIDLQ